MDFNFTTEQDEAAALAATILRDRTTNDRQKEVEAAGSRLDAALWQELADAGLLSLAVPEEHGGAGLGLVELCRVLVEIGRTVLGLVGTIVGAQMLLWGALDFAPSIFLCLSKFFLRESKNSTVIRLFGGLAKFYNIS